MMMIKRTKTSMMLAAIAAAMTFASTGCTDEEKKTPAEQLLQAAQDGNKRIDKLLSHHEVLTTQIVSETLAPIDRANESFNSEVLAWQDTPGEPVYIQHEIETYQKAGVEIANLTAKLDAEGFALTTTTTDTCTADGSGSAGSDCGCSEVATDPVSTDPVGGGSGITRQVATADDPQGIDKLTEKVYWKELACKAACAAAQLACTTACGPLVVGGVTVPAAIACALLCTTAGAACNVACGRKFKNCW